MVSIAEQFLRLQFEFTDNKLAALPRTWTLRGKDKSEVAEAKNPFSSARDPYCEFVCKYLNGPIDVLFLGINPSPTGMGRNGIPFGDIDSVIDYLGIIDVQLKNGIKIADLPRGGRNGEYSGKHLWGLIKELAGQPQNFFDHCFVHNYCPLLFTTHKDGRTKNVTPEDLADKSELEAICDEYFLKTLQLLNVRILVVMGVYLKKRIKKCFEKIAQTSSEKFSDSTAGDFQEDASAYYLPNIVKIEHPAAGQYKGEDPEVWKEKVLTELQTNRDFKPYLQYFRYWDATFAKYVPV